MTTDVLKPASVTLAEAQRAQPPPPAAWPRAGTTAASPAPEAVHATAATHAAVLDDLAREALMTSRAATSLLLNLLQAVADLETATATGPAAGEPLDAAAERVGAEAQTLTGLAQGVACCGRAMHDIVGRLRRTPQAHLARLAHQLQQMQQEHTYLVRVAERWLAGGPPLAARQVEAAAECALGAWCGQHQAGPFAAWPAFAALAEPHAAYHRALARVLFTGQQAQHAAAEAALAQLHHSHHRLAAALGALRTGMLEGIGVGGQEA